MACPDCKYEEFIYRKAGVHVGKYCKRCNAKIGDWVEQIPEVMDNLEKDPPKNKSLF